ncbi:MAG: hypothetical protein ACOYO1_11630 [Bacteroidales bacterium]
MKFKTFFAIIGSLMLFSFMPASQQNYLYLNTSELKQLGIHLNNKGLYYINTNPQQKQEGGSHCTLAFYCNSKNYVTSIHRGEFDDLNPMNNEEKILLKNGISTHDFYPMIVGNTKGNASLDNYSVFHKEIKLLPVAVCMSESNLSNRKDTIIVWFKPTTSLIKALPENINIEDYLRVPEINVPESNQRN